MAQDGAGWHRLALELLGKGGWRKRKGQTVRRRRGRKT